MCLPGNSVLSSTEEDHQNKKYLVLVTCSVTTIFSVTYLMALDTFLKNETNLDRYCLLREM